MVRCKSTPVWLDIIPVNWAEASERIRQQFVYIFADFNFSNDLWSLWVWILQQIRPALASGWLTNWHDCEVLILHPSSSIVWYPVYPLILSTKSDTYFIKIWFHLHSTFITFSMPRTLPRSTGSIRLQGRHDRPFTTQAGRPSRWRGGYAASGCCSGTAVAKAGSSARRFSSEAKWGNLGGFHKVKSLGESMGLKYIEISWHIIEMIEIFNQP